LIKGRIVTAREVICASQVRGENQRERIQFERALHFLNGFRVPAQRQQQHVGVPVVGQRVVGIQLRGAFEFLFGALPVPIRIDLHGGERSMGFRQAVVQFERLLGSETRVGKQPQAACPKSQQRVAAPGLASVKVCLVGCGIGGARLCQSGALAGRQVQADFARDGLGDPRLQRQHVTNFKWVWLLWNDGPGG